MIYRTTTGPLARKYEIRTRKICGKVVDVSVIIHNQNAIGGIMQRSYTVGHYVDLRSAMEAVDSVIGQERP